MCEKLTGIAQCVKAASVKTRGVESKSLEVGKSLKIGKNRIKSEKSEFIFLLDFFRLFGNF